MGGIHKNVATEFIDSLVFARAERVASQQKQPEQAVLDFLVLVVDGLTQALGQQVRN